MWHEFTLAFLVSPADQADAVARVRAKVPDVTASLISRGRLEVQFARSSDSAYQVLKQAVADVHAAVPAAQCILY